MKHPSQWLPERVRKPLFWIFLAWTLVLMLLFQLLNRPLSTSAAPMGIISLQLAWTAEKTSAILSSWGATAREYAAFGLGFDYLFMSVYAAALALGSLLAAGRHPGFFARLGSWVGLPVSWLPSWTGWKTWDSSNNSFVGGLNSPWSSAFLRLPNLH